MRVHKAVLDKHIRTAGVIEVPANITNTFSVHHVKIFIFMEIFTC